MSQRKSHDLECPNCGSSRTFKRGKPEKRTYGLAQRYQCKECDKSFTPKSIKPSSRSAKSADLDCPNCGSSRTFKRGSPKKRKRGFVQPCVCKGCGKYFLEDGKKGQTPAKPADVDCPNCGSSKTFKDGSPQKRKYGLAQRCRCKECGKCFLEGGRKRRVVAKSADVDCPNCRSSRTFKHGSPRKRKHGGTVQVCLCKECGKYFLEGGKTGQTPAKPADVDCPYCGSPKTVKRGSPQKHEHGLVQRCECKECGKSFTPKSMNVDRRKPRITTAKPAELECPHCGSSKTFKDGKSKRRKHGNTVQPCVCKDCGKHFLEGGKKRLRIFLKGKLIHTCYDPPGLQHMENITCPNCNQKKAVLKTQFYDNKVQKQIIFVICLGCGQEFKGEGRPWSNHTSRMLGKTILPQPWKFEEDIWDLRELYPNTPEYDFRQLFIYFNNSGSSWFKDLLKHYILWRIKSGIKSTTVKTEIYKLKHFGRFIDQQGVTCMQQVNRSLLATYYNQERDHIKKNTLTLEIKSLDTFFRWGNETQNFITLPRLITAFDYPKLFKSEPDPLEESVIEAIRDNLHILPEPLQLMFMLGFWLGTRPSELCHLRKDCLKLDPDGTTWWVEFEREKSLDEHRLFITTDLVRLIQQQQTYINELFGEDYSYLFCHYQQLGKTSYPSYPFMKPIKRPPIVTSGNNPMVKTINCLIQKCNIQDSNGKLVKFTGAILRPSRATHLINNGFSLDFVRIWLKHRDERTTRRYYTRYEPGQLLDVATVMANVDQKFYPYESNPESLRQNPELHELDGLKMLNGEPLYGYCSFREFCPRFGRCYTCGFHVASADKLSHYKSQLEQLKIKEEIAFNHGSSEIYESYKQIVNALESIIDALEGANERDNKATNSPELG
ncbi:site-specific integrase [Nostoc sp. FACHB-110]|uniref:site-specific integrase n=1 Tax=Nostoc sp. FACHB-110 TaxID=2692834 RepID=UPI001688D8AE|nr:site-specific integrase [Nostoc sp. FACHB-110]MBD2436590.1 site-specific integrase [Nostoc sp. FACHB-110]